MIPYANVKCTVPNCKEFYRVEIRDDQRKKGKPEVCYDHRKLTMDDVKKMFGNSTSKSEVTLGKS